MAIKSSMRSYSGLVQKYIGTAYDVVKEVYDNLDAITNLETHIGPYLGAYTVAPTERNDGTPLQEGDFYVDPDTTYFYFYTVTEWLYLDPDKITQELIYLKESLRNEGYFTPTDGNPVPQYLDKPTMWIAEFAGQNPDDGLNYAINDYLFYTPNSDGISGIYAKMAQKGDKGDTGDTGDTGVQGPSGGQAIISDAAPANPVLGQKWYASLDGRTYIWYVNVGDIVVDGQWVEDSPQGLQELVPLIEVTETFTLTDGQLVVNLVDTDSTTAKLYVGGVGRLLVTVDYAKTSASVITLTNSYPNGTILTSEQTIFN